MDPSRTSPLTPRKQHGSSFFSTWVKYAETADVEIQHLSRLALLKRAKTSNRYRVLQNGVIVALFKNKKELEAFLESNKTLPDSEELRNKVVALPDEGATPREMGPTDANAPSVPSHTSTVTADRRPRLGSLSADPTSGGPLPKSPRSPTETPQSAAAQGGSSKADEGLKSKLSLVFKGHSASEERFEEEDQVKQFLRTPTLLDPDAPLAQTMTRNTLLSPQEQVERRRALRKPPTPEQEPAGEKQRVLFWEYDAEKEKWSTDLLWVRIAEDPFAVGSTHEVHKMEVGEPGKGKMYVAKAFTPDMEKALVKPDPNEPGLGVVMHRSAMAHYARSLPKMEFEPTVIEQLMPYNVTMTKQNFIEWFNRLSLMRQDVEMQEFCQLYADAFNKLNPAKQVSFLPCFLIGRCSLDPGYKTFLCEPFIEGDIVQYNTDGGGVLPRAVERNTPQAFSHFSYIHSGKKRIIVGLQGFGDAYINPQIHSATKTFGVGDMGQEGIDRFFKTHRCNNVCVRLGLAAENDKFDPAGTV